MPEKEFESMYKIMQDDMSRFSDPETRVAYISGWLKGIHPETTITAAQVSRLLALRCPENE